jgi:septal ring factor EnvC (AmiA/AmiB activator)
LINCGCRQLSELKEAAEAAEEALGTQMDEIHGLKQELAKTATTMASLEARLGQLKDEIETKNRRIAKLEAVKLTADQVEKLNKMKAERAQFAVEVGSESRGLSGLWVLTTPMLDPHRMRS